MISILFYKIFKIRKMTKAAPNIKKLDEYIGSFYDDEL